MNIIRAILASVGFVAILVAVSMVGASSRKKETAYRNYMAMALNSGSSERLWAKNGELLKIPGKQDRKVEINLSWGIGYRIAYIDMFREGRINERAKYDLQRIPTVVYAGKGVYGDLDLSTFDPNLPFVVHILRGDAEKGTMEYTVSSKPAGG